MDNIIISNMTIQDLNSISNNLISDFDNFWTLSILEDELSNPNSRYVVAKLNDNIVGFGGIWKSVDDIHITNIVVKKDMRNNGVGSIILNNLIQLSKKENITSITLEVKSTNISAIKLYEKFNFKKVGIRKKYYNNYEDAIIMTMEVNK